MRYCNYFSFIKKMKCKKCKTEKRVKKSMLCLECDRKEYPMKFCFKCKQTKPITDFYKDRNTKDGLTCWCRICISFYRRKKVQAYEEAQDIIRNYRTSVLYGLV